MAPVITKLPLTVRFLFTVASYVSIELLAKILVAFTIVDAYIVDVLIYVFAEILPTFKLVFINPDV